MSEEQATVDVAQQATAPAPKTQPTKNPKRVAAGKAAAHKTKEFREAEKKALAEAEVKAIKAEAKAAAALAKLTPTPAAAPVEEPQPAARSEQGGFNTTQWLTIGSIIVGLIGLYYKREELQVAFKTCTAKKQPWDNPQPSPAPYSAIPRPIAPTTTTTLFTFTLQHVNRLPAK